MLTLYITRHGETVWNTEKRLQGWMDSELTINGIDNAKLLGEKLKDIEFKNIYSSPSKRTVKTAELVAGDRKQKILEDNNLKEIYMGEWEGQKQSEIQMKYPDQFHAFWNTPHLYRKDNGETFDQLHDRVVAFLKRLQEENQEGNVLLVTHTVVIKILLAYFKKESHEKLWGPPYIYDTCLNIIKINNETTEVLLEGDISHRMDCNRF